MKKYVNYLILFLLIITTFFIYNSYKLVKQTNKLKNELKLTNEGYDNNIQYAIQLEDSLNGMWKKLDSVYKNDFFSLQGNAKANQYLNDTFQTEKNWNNYIIAKLLKTNEKQTGDNPLIPYAGMAGAMRFDDAKVLNHRWIIAHFTDGEYQGELIIRYDIDKQKNINFKVLDQTLYK